MGTELMCILDELRAVLYWLGKDKEAMIMEALQRYIAKNNIERVYDFLIHLHPEWEDELDKSFFEN